MKAVLLGALAVAFTTYVAFALHTAEFPQPLPDALAVCASERDGWARRYTKAQREADQAIERAQRCEQACPSD